MTFEFRRLRFHFRALDALVFPAGKAANVLRGGLGCVLHEQDPQAYAQVFAPHGLDGPSGLADRPRPFVFRVGHLEGLRAVPGELLHLDVHLFDLSTRLIEVFENGFRELARRGLGPGRGRAALARVEHLPSPAVLLNMSEPARSVRVRFLTPTELKSRDALAARPEFAVLFARLRDRISTLRAAYGAGPLAIDFRAMGERAARIRTSFCEIRQAAVERRSSRTGQTHPLGGFTGEAGYEGDLAEFMPYLRAGKWTGVGRQTVWGKGELEIHVLE